MNEPIPEKSIKENILKAIETGHVQMRPRWHFGLKTILGLVGVILVSLTLLYLASFIVFMLHKNGVWFIPVFGLAGLREFLVSLPWLVVLAALVFVVVLEILVRRYSFSYKRPLVVSVIAVLVFVILGSIVVAQTHFHETLFNRAVGGNLPFAGRLYNKGMGSRPNVTPGEVMETTNSGFFMETPREEKFQVIIGPQTRLPFGTDFVVGDMVVVLGERSENIIHALGIREVQDIMVPINNNPTPPPDIIFYIPPQ